MKKGKLKTCLTTASVAMIACSAIPLQAKAETLKEAIHYLIETNPEIRSNVYIRKSSDETLTIAKADYFPRIDLDAGAGVEDFDEPFDETFDPRMVRLRLRQNLFTGFGTKYDVERAKHKVNSDAYRVQASTSDTALLGVQTYLDVLRRKELIDLAQVNLKNHQRIEDQIRLRSESGVGRAADMDQIASRITLARSQLIDSKSNMLDAQTNYLAVIGHLPEDISRPDSPDEQIPVSLDDAQRKAIVNHPMLKAIEEDLSAREAQHGIAKSEYYPKLDFELDQRWDEEVDGFEGKEESLLYMLRLRYNLFSGLRHKGRIGETRYLIEDAREERNNVARQALESIRLSWITYESELEKYQDLEERVVATKKTVEAYKKQWDIGQRTLLDLLDSEAEFINASRDLVDSRFQLDFAKYRLLNGIGTLVPAMGLDYPEEAEVTHYAEIESKQ
jgi:adhesin transport system outer membrane protein